jgi:hypothetical protein
MTSTASLRCAAQVAAAVVLVCGLTAPAAGQSPPPGDGAELRPAEIQRLFDAYLVMEAQQTLGLSDTQYPTFLTRLRALQETRRRHLQARGQLLAELAQQARFRVFEEQIERRKLELMLRARQAARQSQRPLRRQ